MITFGSTPHSDGSGIKKKKKEKKKETGFGL